MTTPARASKLHSVIDTDVCIVGSGAGGAVMAKALAEGGWQVVVLEKGRRYTKEDFTQREDEMLPRLYEECGMRSTADQSIIIMHAKGVGGTTLVNDNICFRAPAFVLAAWTRLGIERITPEAMQPHYEKVEQEISVSRIQDEEVSRNDRIFHRGAEQIGLQPRRFLHNRNGCIGCGFCYCGCAYDRKQNMALTYLPNAEARGARIMPDTEAQTIIRHGDHIEAMVARQCDADGGQITTLEIRAKHFVLSGGGISTPALLLRNGFGRMNANIGRHLTLHPIMPNIGLMEEPTRFSEGIPQCEYVDQLSPDDDAGFLLEGMSAHPVLTSFVIPSFGSSHQRVMEQFNHFTTHYIIVKDRPQGRVCVTPDGAVSIHYTLHEREQQSLREGLKLSAKLFFAAGAKRVCVNHVDMPLLEHERQIDQIDRLRLESNCMALFAPHQMSSCRMGSDPRTSVTNAYGQVHGLDNLYIADASLFPSSLGYNPQVTIMALAMRSAEFLLNNN